MTSDARRTIRRFAGWTVLGHTALVLVLVAMKNVLWELGSPAWKIEKILRLIELPVLWAVDPAMQKIPLIPPWAAFGRLSVASSVSELIAYGVFGGAFYGAVAAGIAFLRERGRAVGA